jgi:hypothetical protein
VQYSLFKNWIFFCFWFLSIISADISGNIRVCALMVSFQEDDKESTTGNGKFLSEIKGTDCESYHIDPPPHDRAYFYSQLNSVNNYFQSVSYGQFGIDLTQSSIYPLASASYELQLPMSYYYPYNEQGSSEDRLVELFTSSIEEAYLKDGIDFDIYDLIIIFHAGIGQDFALPFLDPTPEDIPSTFIDSEMIYNSMGIDGITIGAATINKGILLPETQNHLNYEISVAMFSGEPDPCDYQYGLTGTLSLMIGFAVGLPPLWEIEGGESRIGVFGLMDQGSNNGRGLVPSRPDPWSRIYAGWESPITIQDNTSISLPKIGKDNIIRIDINDSEYFLIENRVNHFRKGVSLDSIRFRAWEESGNYPSFIKSLKDSVSIDIDANGVITNISNYDIGLPGSGLLIWHIDENYIQSGMGDYSINKNIGLQGIDIEESDGAQDIGYQSFFMFNDPSSGYFGDMWFSENEEYFRANPQNEGLLPIFNETTYPNTNANNGSKSYISIENIGQAGDTVTFNVINPLKPYGYGDSTVFFRDIFEFNNAESSVLIGGEDSLWFSSVINLSDRTYFHSLVSNEVIIGVNHSGQYSLVEIFEYFDSNVILSLYEYDNDYFSFRSSTAIDSLIYPVYRNNFQERSLLNQDQWIDHTSSVFGANNVYRTNKDDGLTSVTINGEENNLNNIFPISISGIDLQLDAILDILVIDKDGTLSGYNSQLSLLSNFPMDYKVTGPLLSQNIMGDDHPEIIVKSLDSSAIYILDYQGRILSTISTEKNDQIVLISTINQKNCIVTRNNIFQFFDSDDNGGNEWNYVHGNQGNSRSVDIEYQSKINTNNIVSRAYCYPNPIKSHTGKIRVETNNASFLELHLYDASGFFVKRFTKNISPNGVYITEWELDANNLESGIYFARLEAKSNSQSDDSKIIKIAVIK